MQIDPAALAAAIERLTPEGRAVVLAALGMKKKSEPR